MDGLWNAIARALSRDPGWQGARDGKRGYPGAGHGMAVATYRTGRQAGGGGGDAGKVSGPPEREAGHG